MSICMILVHQIIIHFTMEKGMSYLKKGDYRRNIVLEIALDYLKGNTFNEKISDLYSFIKKEYNPLIVH